MSSAKKRTKHTSDPGNGIINTAAVCLGKHVASYVIGTSHGGFPRNYLDDILDGLARRSRFSPRTGYGSNASVTLASVSLKSPLPAVRTTVKDLPDHPLNTTEEEREYGYKNIPKTMMLDLYNDDTMSQYFDGKDPIDMSFEEGPPEEDEDLDEDAVNSSRALFDFNDIVLLVVRVKVGSLSIWNDTLSSGLLLSGTPCVPSGPKYSQCKYEHIAVPSGYTGDNWFLTEAGRQQLHVTTSALYSKLQNATLCKRIVPRKDVMVYANGSFQTHPCTPPFDTLCSKFSYGEKLCKECYVETTTNTTFSEADKNTR